jgi:hypothetical protein
LDVNLWMDDIEKIGLKLVGEKELLGEDLYLFTLQGLRPRQDKLAPHLVVSGHDVESEATSPTAVRLTQNTQLKIG